MLLNIDVRYVCCDCKRASAVSIALYFACRFAWVVARRVVHASISLLSEVVCEFAALIAVVTEPVVGSIAALAAVFSAVANEFETAACVPAGSAAYAAANAVASKVRFPEL